MNTTKSRQALTARDNTNKEDCLERDKDAEDEEDVDGNLAQCISGVNSTLCGTCRRLDGSSDTDRDGRNQRDTEK